MKQKTLIGLDYTNFTRRGKLTGRMFSLIIPSAEEVLRKEGMKIPEGRIELSLVDDKTIRDINKKYRHKDASTDVVSLSYVENARNKGVFPPDDDLIGEIFISVETAEKQAASDGRPLKKEVIFLFVHGLLHVLGFDHIKAADRKVMFALQEKVMGEI